MSVDDITDNVGSMHIFLYISRTLITEEYTGEKNERKRLDSRELS